MKISKVCLVILFSLTIIFANEDYLVVYHSNFDDPDGWQTSLENILESHGHQLIFYSVSNGYTNTNIRGLLSEFKNDLYPSLKYVLLVGKGKDSPIPEGETYPAYNHTVSSSYGNYIPFYYYIDNYYWAKQIRDIPSDWQYVSGLDLSIGRVPVKSIGEIENWVQKLEDYYQNMLIYHGYNDTIRFFGQNNNNIDNGCNGWQTEVEIDKSKEYYLNSTSYSPVIHYMKDVHVSDHCDHSAEADEYFIDNIEEGAGLTCVSGTGGGSANYAGFLFPPNISTYSFSNANPNFIFGNTCYLGNTSDPGCAYGTVLENLLVNPNDGIVGALGPTVATTEFTVKVGYDAFFNIIVNKNINTVGLLARELKNDFSTCDTVHFLSSRGGVRLKSGTDIHDYHAKSMVLYGDPSMPLALYQHKNSNITSNTVWQGSIVVENDISVSSGVTLTIQPGTGIFFKNNAQLKVYGTLIAQGNSSYHIKFSAATESPTVGSWDGIYFEDSSIDASCILKYCDIQYAQYGIFCNHANPKIENNTITHNSYGIYLYYSSPTYVNTNNISYNSSGVYGISASPTLTDNLLNMNGSYGAYFFGGAPSFSTNSFKRNEYGAYFTNSSFPKFGPTSGTGQGNNVIYHNDTWGIRAQFYSDPFMGSSDAYNNRIGGYNSIYYNSQANAYAYYYSDIEAQWNWWGSNPPLTSKFFYSIAGTIDFSNYLGTDPGGGSSLGKIAASNMAIDNTHNRYEEAGFNPKKPNPNKLSDLWLWGHDLYINNKVKDAVQIYKILINKFSSSDQSKKALGKIYYWSQEIGKTDISLYLSSIIENSEIDPDLKPIAYELLADFHQKNGKIINAISAYETVINEYPKADNQKFVLFKLVLCEKNDLKNTENANNYLSMLRQNYPDDEVTIFACEEMGEEVDWALAKRNYEPPAELSVVLPEKFALRGNYPNPFNPSTTIAFNLPEESKVSLIIYDITGREVIKLVDDRLPAGFRKVVWDGKDKTGQTVASGVYLYSLKTSAGFNATKKMVFVR